MKEIELTSDDALLGTLGARIARYRLNNNQTQASLAEAAGVSLPTLQRMERGQSVQLSNFIRILRVLNMLARWEQLLPEPPLSPIQQAKLQGKTRRRASRTDSQDPTQKRNGPWQWGTDE